MVSTGAELFAMFIDSVITSRSPCAQNSSSHLVLLIQVCKIYVVSTGVFGCLCSWSSCIFLTYNVWYLVITEYLFKLCVRQD